MSDDDDNSGNSASPPPAPHCAYGKMSETTTNWILDRNAAFRKLALKPSGNSNKSSDQLPSLPPQLERDPALWVVTEKVHGSNMSFVIDSSNKRVRCAKREEFLDDASDADNSVFFGYRAVKQRFEAAAARAFDRIAAQLPALCLHFAQQQSDDTDSKRPPPSIEHVTIYGELFGGAFPNLESKHGEHGAVQDGLYYSNRLEFIAFDVKVDFGGTSSSSSSSSSDSVFLDFLPAMRCLAECGFMVATPLALGTFEDACNFDIDFVSKIPERLKIPREAQQAIAKTNLAEGVVCRTNISNQFVALKGNPEKRGERTIFKRKQNRFAQACEARAKEVGASTSASEKDQLLNFVSSFVTRHIVDSAVSKVGKPKNAKIRQRIFELVCADVEDAAVEQQPFVLAVNLASKAVAKGGGKKGKAAAAAASSSSSSSPSPKELLEKHRDDVESVVKEKLVEFLV